MTKPQKTISEKMQELEKATEWFYSEEFSLEKAATHYKATMELAQEIEKDLAQLKNEITLIEEDFTKE